MVIPLVSTLICLQYFCCLIYCRARVSTNKYCCCPLKLPNMSTMSQQFLFVATGGHFACACVNPLNDSSVGSSNLMAGNRKLARKVTVLLKAISLVLWIPHFPSKNILHHKNQTFSTRVFTCRFFSSRFPWPFKDFQDSTPKSHVPV